MPQDWGTGRTLGNCMGAGHTPGNCRGYPTYPKQLHGACAATQAITWARCVPLALELNAPTTRSLVRDNRHRRGTPTAGTMVESQPHRTGGPGIKVWLRGLVSYAYGAEAVGSLKETTDARLSQKLHHMKVVAVADACSKTSSHHKAFATSRFESNVRRAAMTDNRIARIEQT